MSGAKDSRTTRPAPDELEVSVLGPSTGESIVLHLPGVGWGVVDCCRDTEDYLATQGVTELAFAALTHPHRDHYAGLDRVLAARPVRRVWIYSGRSTRELRSLQQLQIEHGRGDFHGFTAVLKAMQEAQTSGAEARTMSACKPLLVTRFEMPDRAPVGVSITALSPSAADEERYLTILAAAMPQEGELMPALPDRAHNLIASALMITAGDWCVCLGSDVEAESWAGIVADATRPPLRAQLVKVSHHGSANAHSDDAWNEHAGGAGARVEHAVVTPFATQRLPKPSDLERLRGRVGALHLTAARSTIEPRAVYRPTITKHARTLRNWRVVDERFGHVRYRASLSSAEPLRVEAFGRAADVSTA